MNIVFQLWPTTRGPPLVRCGHHVLLIGIKWRSTPLSEDDLWNKIELATPEEVKEAKHLLQVFQPARTICWLRMYYVKNDEWQEPLKFLWRHYTSTFEPYKRRRPLLDLERFTACMQKTFRIKPYEKAPGCWVFPGLSQVHMKMSAMEADRQHRRRQVARLEKRGIIERPKGPLNEFQKKLRDDPLLPWPNNVPQMQDLYDKARMEISATGSYVFRQEEGKFAYELEKQAVAEAQADLEDLKKRKKKV